jgi:hypothetical protein
MGVVLGADVLAPPDRLFALDAAVALRDRPRPGQGVVDQVISSFRRLGLALSR